MSRRFGFTKQQQHRSDQFSAQLLREYRGGEVPLRRLAQRHDLSINAVWRRMQRAREMERETAA